jgi:hypothetical protein
MRRAIAQGVDLTDILVPVRPQFQLLRVPETDHLTVSAGKTWSTALHRIAFKRLEAIEHRTFAARQEERAHGHDLIQYPELVHRMYVCRVLAPVFVSHACRTNCKLVRQPDAAPKSEITAIH